MRRLRCLLLILVVLGGVGSAEVEAQAREDEETHAVTAETAAYSALQVDPVAPFTSGPGAARTVTTTYSVVTNNPAPQRIVASIQGTPPTGVRVQVELEAPEGASADGGGSVEVLSADGSSSSRTLVTGVGQVSATGLTVTYTTEATVQADPGDKQVRLEFQLVE